MPNDGNLLDYGNVKVAALSEHFMEVVAIAKKFA